MSNRLASENSPYLLQHANNPVEWHPWGTEALEKARKEDKPIFLSIGYAACHWCHVMAHESFEDTGTAALMNEHFVNIKVDREERPDLDSIYMSAVVAMTGQGGWPMSVFLTPELEPFFGGTYFPPTRRYNMPSFREVLLSVSRAWREDKDEILQSGRDIREHLASAASLGWTGGTLEAETMEKAALVLAQSYDWKSGGWGQAPKFPQPMAIEFLLLKAQRGDRFALEMAIHALRAMARGGMYDVVGGGFSRYSTDDHWLVPHFEKMLYDNAQLARAYLHAYLLSGEAFFRQVCEETLDFIAREMRHPQGGFFSSLDADSEGEEGKFYLWTPAEIRAALQGAESAELVLAAYGVTESGNFEGGSILQRAMDNAALAKQFGLSEQAVSERLQELRARLLDYRSQRVRPGTDDKVLTAWNALALAAFAEAGRYLQRREYLEIAIQNADFLLNELHTEDRLLRSWRKGKARHNAYLEDYASLTLGLLVLYQSDPNLRWFQASDRLASSMTIHFADPEGGFFDTRADHEHLLRRPKDLQDNATPSGNALAALALLQLAAYTGKGDWRDQAETALGGMQNAMQRYPTAFAQWLIGMDFATGPVVEVAILGDGKDARTRALVNKLWSAYRSRLVAAIASFPPETGSPALLTERSLVDGKPTAYVCQNFICKMPTTLPEELHKQLT